MSLPTLPSFRPCVQQARCTVKSMSRHVTIRLEEEFHERLKARAAALGTTVTALITEVTERELDEDRKNFLSGIEEFADHWGYFQERFGQ
ncbi:ribbon-helix-helix domain-containing protein [Streptomyces sp. ISL-43]|nr:ribbon-helix-helix domain-containing protein [Streptomyces sp. ISL-43]